jgi:hypothetical protein
MDDDLVSHIPRHERLPQRLPLGLAANSGDANTQHLRRHVRHVAGGECIASRRDDHIRRALDLARPNGAARSFSATELLTALVRDPDARSRSAPIDTDDDGAHPRASTVSREGAAWVYEDRTPTTMVIVVPMSTYQGHAIRPSGARVSAKDGYAADSGFAKTTAVIAAIPTAIPRIASR